MAIDIKYGQVSLEKGTIGEDEPVIVFRAQDAIVPDLLDDYINRCFQAGTSEKHIAKVGEAREKILLWQVEHGAKIPGTDIRKEFPKQ